MDLYTFIREQTDQLKQNIDRKTDLILALVKKEARRLQAKNEQYLDEVSKKIENAMQVQAKKAFRLVQESDVSKSASAFSFGGDGDVVNCGDNPSPLKRESNNAPANQSTAFSVNNVFML